MDRWALWFFLAAVVNMTEVAGESFELTLQTQRADTTADNSYRIEQQSESWPAARTAVIVCDVWDAHHCLNAVRRLNEFAPRLNEVLQEARRRGAIIIHAPSDCMPAYAEHPARQRAIAAPRAATLPADIGSWCSSIPAEERASYPIDQSDGGEDDDPEEHAAWAQELTSQGRNPNMPWKRQLETIKVDAASDYITDRGEEVWNILAARGIENVILTGVHVNMCVLGRPFGLRQLSRHGKHVVLMRDMTDSMYNPARWPFVSHHEGTQRVIEHIERHVCPTITSDQVLGGEPFQFAAAPGTADRASSTQSNAARWETVTLPTSSAEAAPLAGWFRCTFFLPSAWDREHVVLHAGAQAHHAWLNGHPLPSQTRGVFPLPSAALEADDVHLLVLKFGDADPADRETVITLTSGTRRLPFAGRWQRLTGDASEPWTMPLPAKFGASPEILFQPPMSP